MDIGFVVKRSRCGWYLSAGLIKFVMKSEGGRLTNPLQIDKTIPGVSGLGGVKVELTVLYERANSC